ncbi:predicted protein [Chaetoceros tenuissimus]|uniref:Uncharacterized protein n=1 Tax=Chaetoceros tenuissimus TaxID=426638 RepID=A0AAD3CSQ6_9STRA|nr:predicted protein [Chaetoceros tenuissimus]
MSVAPTETDLIAAIQLTDDTWNAAVSDTGVLDATIKSKVYKAADDRKFKNIWIAANELFTLMDQHRDRFERLPKPSSKTNIVKKIGDIIYTERQLVDGVYTLSQENLHFKLTNAWGRHNESSGVVLNDIARAFGILCDPNFETEKCTLLKSHENHRAVVDDPALHVRNCCIRLMQAFHDEAYVVSHPANWGDASDVDGYDDLDPNDPQRIQMHTLRPQTFFKTHLIDPVKPVYREACRKWRTDTGGGAGQPENFLDWNPRNDHLFSNFTNGQSPALYTWIFMKDRSMGYVLEAESDDLPQQLQINEDDDDSNSAASSLGLASASKRTKRKSSFNDNMLAFMSNTSDLNEKLLNGLEKLSNVPPPASPARTVVTGNSSSAKKRDVGYYSQVANTTAECSKQIVHLNSRLDKMEKESDEALSDISKKRKVRQQKSLERALRIQNRVLGGLEEELDLEQREVSIHENDESSEEEE